MEAPIEFKDGEKRLICPYNKAHLLLHYRMQEHLVRCRRQHPDEEIVFCTFNSTHRVPKPELKYHLENCSDKISLDKYCYTTNPEPVLNEFQPIVTTTEIQGDGENWDNEDHPTYNPQEYCANNMIIRRACIDKQPKSVKRNFRMEQRKKFSESKEGQPKKPQESGSQPRRPAKTSQGLDSKAIAADEQSELADWLEKVNIGSNVVTTPKLALPKQAEEPVPNLLPARDPQLTNAALDQHFPALGATSMKYSKGRGSRLVQK